ncbi:hypothetical protein A3Q56_08368, partial [Intoshia linei]
MINIVVNDLTPYYANIDQNTTKQVYNVIEQHVENFLSHMKNVNKLKNFEINFENYNIPRPLVPFSKNDSFSKKHDNFMDEKYRESVFISDCFNQLASNVSTIKTVFTDKPELNCNLMHSFKMTDKIYGFILDKTNLRPSVNDIPSDRGSLWLNNEYIIEKIIVDENSNFLHMGKLIEYNENPITKNVKIVQNEKFKLLKRYQIVTIQDF